MRRAVHRGLAAKPPKVPTHVGVDEKSAGRGQDYITVVSDLDSSTSPTSVARPAWTTTSPG